MNQQRPLSVRRRTYLTPESEVISIKVLPILSFSTREEDGTESFTVGSNSYGNNDFDE